MSRVYITASMQHTNFGIALPTLSVETTDHLGGGYHIKGLHPSTIAKLSGKLPEVKKGERFDLKFNVNAKRCSLALVVATTKHLPHIEWSSESGMGKLPMGVGALASTFLLGNKQSSKTEQRSPSKASNGHGHSRDSRDSKSNRSRHSSSRESHSQSSRSRQSSSRDSRSTRSSPHSSRSGHSTRPQRNLDCYPDYRYKGEDSGYDSDEKYDKYYKRDSRQSQSRSRR